MLIVECLPEFSLLALQVLKGVPDRPEVALVRLREIKYKIEKKSFAQDRSKNTISVKDVVKILEGPCKVSFSPLSSVHLYIGKCIFVYLRISSRQSYRFSQFYVIFRGSKVLLSIFIEGSCLYMIGTISSMLASSVPSPNVVWWSVEHVQMGIEMYVFKIYFFSS